MEDHQADQPEAPASKHDSDPATPGVPEAVDAASEAAEEVAAAGEGLVQSTSASNETAVESGQEAGEDGAVAGRALEATTDTASEAGAGDVEDAEILQEQPIDVTAAAATPPDAATVGDLPVVASESEPAAKTAPPGDSGGDGAPPLVVQTAPEGGDPVWGCLRAVLLVLLGAGLGAMLTAALLLVLNGNLLWPSRGSVAAIDRSVAELSGRVDGLEGTQNALSNDIATTSSEIDTLTEVQANQAEQLAANQANMADLETQTGDLADEMAVAQEQLADLETRMTTMDEALNSLSTTVEAVSTTVGVVQQQVDEIAVSARRSDAFLTGLQRVLAELETEGQGPAASVSPTLTPTLAATPTVTATLELTVTPALESTTPLTVTPEVTPTATPTATNGGATPEAPVETATPTEAAGQSSQETPLVTATAEAPATAATPPDQAPTETPSATPLSTPVPVATPTPSVDRSTILGVAFEDTNRNGRLDPGEFGMEGVAINLLDSNQVQVAEATTNANGAYRFDGLPPGRYVVLQTDLSGYGSSTLNGVVVIVRGNDVATVDFGDYQLD